MLILKLVPKIPTMSHWNHWPSSGKWITDRIQKRLRCGKNWQWGLHFQSIVRLMFRVMFRLGILFMFIGSKILIDVFLCVLEIEKYSTYHQKTLKSLYLQLLLNFMTICWPHVLPKKGTSDGKCVVWQQHNNILLESDLEKSTLGAAFSNNFKCGDGFGLWQVEQVFFSNQTFYKWKYSICILFIWFSDDITK